MLFALPEFNEETPFKNEEAFICRALIEKEKMRVLAVRDAKLKEKKLSRKGINSKNPNSVTASYLYGFQRSSRA